jgi:hypothetical protein
VGALHGKRAKKGVFITTGAFSSEVEEYAPHIDPKIVLINGDQMAELMIDFNIGVTKSSTYEIKWIDSDYFGEEQSLVVAASNPYEASVVKRTDACIAGAGWPPENKK